MQITANTLNKFCSQEWLSKSYSEYLYDCANIQAELMSDVLSSSSDDQLDGLIESEESNFGNVKNQLEEYILSKLIEDGVSVSYLNPYSQPFSDKLDELITRQDPRVTVSLDYVLSRYQYFNNTGKTEINVFIDDPHEIMMTCQPISNRISTLTNAIATKYHMGDQAVYALGNGFVNFKNMINGLLVSGAIGAGARAITLTATNGQDTSIANIVTDFDSIIEDMKSSFASSIAWASGFLSVGANNIADAVSNFNATISTMISDTTEKFAAVINNVRATVSTYAGNISSFFNQAYYQLGWKDVVDDVFTIIDATKVSEFTGASPFSSIYLKTAGDTLLATAKTIGAVAAGIFKGLLNIVNQGWKKVRGFASEFTNNPIDYKIYDSKDGSFVMTNAQYHTDDSTNNFSFKIDTGQGDYEDQVVATKMAISVLKCAGSWYSFDTHFGILSFKFKESATPLLGTVYTAVQIVYKPKALWYKSLEDSGLMEFYRDSDNTWGGFGHQNIGSTGILNFDTWLENGDLFFHDDMDGTNEVVEGLNLLGFHASIQLFQYVAHACMMEVNTGMNGKYGFTIPSFTDRVSGVSHSFRADTYPSVMIGYQRDPLTPVDQVTVPSNITNEIYAKTCAGDFSYGNDPDVDQFYYYNRTLLLAEQSPYGYTGLIEIVGGLLCAFLCQQYDKNESPTEFFWLPYCKDSYANDSGRYKIISDSEHSNVVGIVTAALIVIAAVVAAVILGATVVKLFKARRLTKWAAKQGVLDNKMWNGGKLTPAEQLRYLRAVKKNNAAANATSGLAGAASAATNAAKYCNSLMNSQVLSENSVESQLISDNYISELDSVKTLITG